MTMFLSLLKFIKKYYNKFTGLFTKAYKGSKFLSQILRGVRVIFYIFAICNLFIATPIIILFHPIDILVDMFDYLINSFSDAWSSLIKNIYTQIYQKLDDAVNNPPIHNINQVDSPELTSPLRGLR